MDEIPEPFRSIINNLGRPLPVDIPRRLRRRSSGNVEELPQSIQLHQARLNEMTQSVFDESVKDLVEESHKFLPDEVLQTLLEDFNETLPDDVPRPPRDQAMQTLRYTLIKQQIEKNEDLVNDCKQIVEDQYKQHLRDNLRQSINDEHHEGSAVSFPQTSLNMWRLMYPKYKGKLQSLKPDVDEISAITNEIQSILQGLCDRDERFSFIQLALEEFLNGNRGLHDLHKRVDLIIASDPTNVEDSVAMDKLSELLTTCISLGEADPADAVGLRTALYEIIHTTIYEMLNVFRQDLTVEKPSTNANLIANLEILRSLYEKSKLSKPQPAIQIAPKPRPDNESEASYPYPTRLNSKIGEVRILKILPGLWGDRIECELSVRNIYCDDIPEALSYVWGRDKSPEKILVDKTGLEVTKNLSGALKDLRRSDTPREIWVDAVCINQSDPIEKTGQVRLMREIYSRAKDTVIWLSGSHVTSERTEDLPDNQRQDNESFNMEGWYAPFPAGLGEIDVDQYDLAEILKECLKHSIEDTWSKKQTVLYVMLMRCAALVTLHSWWERIWTIQECACPPSAPTFLFRGHTFSFNDFTAAMNISARLSSRDPHLDVQIKNLRDKLGSELYQAVSRIAGSQFGPLSRGPLLLHYRRGLESERNSTVKSLTVLLAMAESYRATDPRDKVFALQSLLHGCMGRLINVDYEEHCEAVFRRVTARHYNSTRSMYLMGHFKFWFEAPSSREEPTGPSWVLDFTYTDAPFRGSGSATEATDKVSLDGFICESKNSVPEIEYDEDAVHFCTPNIFFCTGRCIDQIHRVALVPNFSNTTLCTPFVALVSLAVQIFNARESLLDLPVTTEFGDEPAGLISLVHFFSMTDRVPQEAYRDKICSIRNKELAGKPIFITKKGLVGIATESIKPGDFLTWLHGSPIYLILREMEHDNNMSDNEQQHQIVARAVVNDKLLHNIEDMRTLISSTPVHHFQII